VQKCSRWLALLIRKEKLGLLESLVLKVLKNWFWHNVTYYEANTSNYSITCNKHLLCECTKERGSDFEHFGERITEFGAMVAKIWRKEF
jgi:hypothetical protein